MIFVGYEPSLMAYQVYDLVTRRIHITRDVVSDEDDKWRWEDGDVNIEFIIDYVPDDNPEVVIVHHGDQAVTPTIETLAASPHATSPPGGQALPGPVVEHVSPPVGTEATLDVDHGEGVPLRFRTLQNIDEVGPVLRLI
jgi:hypothetical protein